MHILIAIVIILGMLGLAMFASAEFDENYDELN